MNFIDNKGKKIISVSIQHYYLARWRMDISNKFGRWVSPADDTIGLVDLRNQSECGRISGFPDKNSYGFFITKSYNANLGLYLGSDLHAPVSRKLLKKVCNILGLPSGKITANTVCDVLAQLLIENGDPTGEDRWRPLTSNRICLSDCANVWNGVLNDYPTWKEKFIEAKQHDFRVIYQELLDGKCHEYHPGKVLDFWSKKHNIDPDVFVPDDIPKQEIIPHQTTVGDTFDDVDGTAILSHTASGPNGGFAWSAINGNAVINTTFSGEPHLVTTSPGGLENNFRAGGVVSGDDHYAQAEFSYPSTGDHDLRIYTRFDVSSWTGYLILAIRADSSNTQLFKVVNGTGTLINDYNDNPGVPLNRLYRLESDGSTHTPFISGSPLASQTDTMITGNFRGGVGGKGDATRIDNYELSDLVSVSITSIKSPVADASVSNQFYTTGFSADADSGAIQTVGESYEITVPNFTGAIKSGDGDSVDGWSPLNATLSVVSSSLRVTSVAGGVTDAQQVLGDLVIGQSYTARCDYVVNGITGQFFIKVGTSPGNTDTGIIGTLSVGPIDLVFVATQETHYISYGTSSSVVAGEFFDIDDCVIDGGFAFDMPNVSGFAVDTAGIPFNTASHAHLFTARNVADSANTQIVVNPQPGWAVVEVSGAVTTSGSVFEGFPLTPVDSDQVYWPIANNTSVLPSGIFSTTQVGGSIGMVFFNTTRGEWEPFGVTIPGGTPGVGRKNMALLGVGK